jgi:uncharacterized protein (TIGR00730 family)
MLRVCVFAGSSAAVDAKYLDAAKAMGAAIAQRGMAMVYGGGAVGLMGACADAALAGKAEVVGVLPRALARSEVAHPNLTELRIVKTLHDRKAVMAALSDAFVALPGGCGTLDELFEAITWRQLGLHDKPIGICDVDGYFGALLRFLREAATAGFVSAGVLEALPVRSSPEDLLAVLFP